MHAMNIARIVLSLPVALALACGAIAAPASLPPDAEHAVEALTNSPRHGEWVTIEREGGAPIKTWVSYPERADKAPVVIVIHEIFGMTDWIRSVADSLAAEGFLAVAPDLLSGMGPNGGGTESFEGDKVREAIRGLSGPECKTRLDAVREWALHQPSASGKSATVGFCWGGSTSFAYATVQPELNGAVVYYGTAPREAESFAHVECAVLGLYGGDDARVTSTVAATEEAMKGEGKEFESYVYEGAGHGFLRQQEGREGANRRAAEGAWEETVRFLKARLE